jgi:hypothetical protein
MVIAYAMTWLLLSGARNAVATGGKWLVLRS